MKIDEIVPGCRLASTLETDEFVGRIEAVQVGRDRYNRINLKLRIRLENGDCVVVSLPPAYVRHIAPILKNYGIEEVERLEGTTWKFVKTKIEIRGNLPTEPYPRYVPVERVVSTEDVEAAVKAYEVITPDDLEQLRRLYGDVVVEIVNRDYKATRSGGKTVWVRKQ